MPCPCGLEDEYNTCCGKFHRAEATPPTAEKLMRSRYSAFVVSDINYLKDTTWPAYQKHFDPAGYAKRSEESIWLGLEINSTQDGSAEDTKGTVNFTAKSMVNGRLSEQQEHSLFKKKNGKWYYVKPLP